MLKALIKRAADKLLGRTSKEPPAAPFRPKKATKIRPVAPTKAETAQLKPFKGLSLKCIHVPKTPEEFEHAAREIIAAGVAGFDTESKPVFRAGEKNHGPHVVQFALEDRAFIFQLHHRECMSVVSELLASERVLKVGFGLRNDRTQIRSKFGVELQALLDLDHVFRKQGYAGEIGVRAAVGTVLNQSFAKSKSVTKTNWALPELTSRQLQYAADDAYAALKVMQALGLSREAEPARKPRSRARH